MLTHISWTVKHAEQVNRKGNAWKLGGIQVGIVKFNTIGFYISNTYDISLNVICQEPGTLVDYAGFGMPVREYSAALRQRRLWTGYKSPWTRL